MLRRGESQVTATSWSRTTASTLLHFDFPSAAQCLFPSFLRPRGARPERDVTSSASAASFGRAAVCLFHCAWRCALARPRTRKWKHRAAQRTQHKPRRSVSSRCNKQFNSQLTFKHQLKHIKILSLQVGLDVETDFISSISKCAEERFVTHKALRIEMRMDTAKRKMEKYFVGHETK